MPTRQIIMIKKHLYITLLGLLSAITAIATPYCDIRKFSIADGLAANTISDIKQGKDKLMWFATWNGLSYYDGYSFHTFRDEPDGVSVLSTNRILNIQPTAANNVWCITQDHKLYLYDTHLCQFLKPAIRLMRNSRLISGQTISMILMEGTPGSHPPMPIICYAPMIQMYSILN